MNRKEIIKAAKRRMKCDLPHKGNWALDTDWQKYIMDIIRMQDWTASNSFEASFYFLKKRAARVYYNTYAEMQYLKRGDFNRAFKNIIKNCYDENIIEILMENE